MSLEYLTFIDLDHHEDEAGEVDKYDDGRNGLHRHTENLLWSMADVFATISWVHQIAHQKELEQVADHVCDIDPVILYINLLPVRVREVDRVLHKLVAEGHDEEARQ